MELTPYQQASDLLNRSKSILICLPVHPSSDAIATGLALFLALEKMGKPARIVCSEFELPLNHSFLPKSNAIERDLKNLRQFIISVDVSKAAVEELSYNIENGRLSIFITPKDGYYEARDVTTTAGNFAYDAAIVVDAADIDDLGRLAKENAEFFYQTPILNIDHQAKNARFGAVNLVDLTATSVSEITYELLKALGFAKLDEQIATAILTGIISKTKSFQTPNVTPRSLTIASHLITSGAKREEIINNLFQSKSISTLKLWGRALARLQERFNGRFIWSALNEQDFTKSAASEAELRHVIDELLVNVPTAELIVLLYSRAQQAAVRAIVSTTTSLDIQKIFPKAQHAHPSFWQVDFPQHDLPGAEQELLRIVSPRLFAR